MGVTMCRVHIDIPMPASVLRSRCCSFFGSRPPGANQTTDRTPTAQSTISFSGNTYIKQTMAWRLGAQAQNPSQFAPSTLLRCRKDFGELEFFVYARNLPRPRFDACHGAQARAATTSFRAAAAAPTTAAQASMS